MPRRTVAEVYDAVTDLREEVHKGLAGHETRITVLENSATRITGLEDRAQERDAHNRTSNARMALLENHDTTDRGELRDVRASLRQIELAQAKSAAIGAVIGGAIAILPQLIAVLR